MCRDRYSWLHQKNEGRWIEYQPSSTELDEATTAQKAWRAMRHGDLQRLDDLERKSLSSFTIWEGDATTCLHTRYGRRAKLPPSLARRRCFHEAAAWKQKKGWRHVS